MTHYKAHHRRLAKVNDVLATCRIPPERVEEEFEWFKLDGDLPEDQRLAALVCDRVKFGRAQGGNGSASAAGRRLLDIMALVVLSEQGAIAKPGAPPTVREELFDEAVYGPATVRRWARVALQVLVCRGGDVTDREFGNEHGLPEFGTVGMHVLGYPRRLATAPYEEQGRRLFDRYDEIRRRLDLTPDDDFEPMAEAILAFEGRGELPADGLMRDFVLAELEIEMLHHHRAGGDVAEVMALLDRTARTTGAKREAAVAEVQRFVRGRAAS
jgi:hypothetical protein